MGLLHKCEFSLFDTLSFISLTLKQNVHQWGDQWNGEDLSIYSLDDKALPISVVPRSKADSLSSSAQPSATRPSEDVAITPDNLKRTLTNASISTSSATADVPANPAMRTTDYELNSHPGYRGAEAYVRPAPVAVMGDILHYIFDLKTCTFSLSLRTAKETTAEKPSEFFLPEFHFPRDGCVVETSGGKWEITTDEGEVQRLRWWHGKGEQNLKVIGTVKSMNRSRQGSGNVEGDEPGYYEAISNWIDQGCRVM